MLRGIIVNRLGQRFVAEDSYYGVIGHHIAYLQQGTAYLIADANSALAPGSNKFRERGCGTLADLAAELQVPPGALEATVAYYNTHSEQRQDPLLRKAAGYLAPLRPPFIAYDLSVGSTFLPAHTFGGLCTDTDSRVLHVDGAPIPGLYAAGRTARGLPTAPYIASGLSLGDATFFGRRAGQHLVRYGRD
jgi:predicted oxidoreductase